MRWLLVEILGGSESCFYKVEIFVGCIGFSVDFFFFKVKVIRIFILLYIGVNKELMVVLGYNLERVLGENKCL